MPTQAEQAPDPPSLQATKDSSPIPLGVRPRTKSIQDALKHHRPTYFPQTHDETCYSVATKTSPPPPGCSEGAEGGEQEIRSTPNVKHDSGALSATRAARNSCTPRHVKLMSSSAQPTRNMQNSAHTHSPVALVAQATNHRAIACFRIPRRRTLRAHPARATLVAPCAKSSAPVCPLREVSLTG